MPPNSAIGSPDQSGIPARRSALFLLDRILGDGKLMAELIGEGALDRLSPPDRARAQRLASDTLRALDRADKLISRHVKKAPPLPIRNILRLGATELAQGAAAHGVVNDLVGIASRNKLHGRLKGLVNAVLRKLATHAVGDWKGLATPRMPGWLRKPLSDAWGKDAIVEIEKAHFKAAPLDLSVKSDPAAWAKALDGTVLPTGSVRVARGGQVSALPGFDKGDWWVQDAAAAIPAKLIGGDSVLDLCAAPGGKSMQLAAMGKAVTAVDVSAARAETMQTNFDRTGLTVSVEVADAFDITGQFDAILLDAPCSATGTMRRHPDLPHAKDGSEFGTLIEQQARLIDHAMTLVKAGGQIVFCTCSLLPDEGEVQIEEALIRHPSLSIDTAAMQADWIEDAWRSPEGGLRLRPDYWSDIGGMDGFYIAALRAP